MRRHSMCFTSSEHVTSPENVTCSSSDVLHVNRARHVTRARHVLVIRDVLVIRARHVFASLGIKGKNRFSFSFYPFYPYNNEYHYGTLLLASEMPVPISRLPTVKVFDKRYIRQISKLHNTTGGKVPTCTCADVCMYEYRASVYGDSEQTALPPPHHHFVCERERQKNQNKFMHTCTHTYIQTYIHTHTHTCVCVCIHTQHTYTHTHIHTVLHRGMGTEPMGTILIRASVPPRKMGTLLLGSWWP
jgi:hypothetical protein